MANQLFVTKIYKIRNNSNGLYSTGGMTPYFTKYGKSWHTVGYVKTHLHLVDKRGQYDNCSLIQFELVDGKTIETDLGLLTEIFTEYF